MRYIDKSNRYTEFDEYVNNDFYRSQTLFWNAFLDALRRVPKRV
jgi:hypothetical protein